MSGAALDDVRGLGWPWIQYGASAASSTARG